MFGIRKRRPPPFGGVHVDDDKDIQEHKPETASRNDLWSEARLLLRDLIFALMIAALVVVFIVQPVKVEGTSMLPRLHDGERIFVNKLIYYDDFRWAPKVEGVSTYILFNLEVVECRRYVDVPSFVWRRNVFRL